MTFLPEVTPNLREQAILECRLPKIQQIEYSVRGCNSNGDD